MLTLYTHLSGHAIKAKIAHLFVHPALFCLADKKAESR
jgi:hypothetical protein